MNEPQGNNINNTESHLIYKLLYVLVFCLVVFLCCLCFLPFLHSCFFSFRPFFVALRVPFICFCGWCVPTSPALSSEFSRSMHTNRTVSCACVKLMCTFHIESCVCIYRTCSMHLFSKRVTFVLYVVWHTMDASIHRKRSVTMGKRHRQSNLIKLSVCVCMHKAQNTTTEQKSTSTQVYRRINSISLQSAVSYLFRCEKKKI